MSRIEKSIDPSIKCPWCGAKHPEIRKNGYYIRDNNRIPQYYCKLCKRTFSFSIIKIDVLKPPREVEIGYKVKVKVKVKSVRGSGIKEVKHEILKSKKIISFSKLKQGKNGLYTSVWDIRNADAGRYQFQITAVDNQGYISIVPKVVYVIQHYDTLINKISLEYGMDPFLIKGMIWKESSFNPEAESPAGAIGLMQLMPETAESLKVRNSYDPEQNIRGGVEYFKDQLKEFGSIRLALGAYNWGPGNVMLAKRQENKFPKGVKNHINRVLELKKICAESYRNYYAEE